MISQFVVYNGLGEILSSGFCADGDVELQPQGGEFVMRGVGQDDTHYVDVSDQNAHVIRLKQPIGLLLVDVHIIADGEDFSIIHGVPAGVSVSVNGTDPVPVTDGEVKFKTVDVGNHSLVFTGVPYVTEEVIVGAV